MRMPLGTPLHWDAPYSERGGIHILECKPEAAKWEFAAVRSVPGDPIIAAGVGFNGVGAGCGGHFGDSNEGRV